MYGYIVMSGTGALVVPWHVSGFGYAMWLDIKDLEEPVGTESDDSLELDLESL